ncbi:MAG: hypothetical protein RLZZ175_2589 [Bacteroidota bacterium]|jgi:glycosyltransferase involved in cell wall biosynthesis
MQTKLSIVSPVYRAEKIIPELVSRIISATSKITDNFEIILVEDCGPDNSWEAIELECKKNTKIKGIKLSRNFGQHYAITAGLNYAKGEWVVVMDCDLQDMPEEIPNLFEKTKEGFDIVLARRYERQDTFLKRLSSKLFYSTLSYLTGVKQDATVANFGIYNHKVIKAIITMKESIKYFPSMVKWVGFKSTKLNVQHAERAEGNSSYNLKRLINLALDIILAYSDKPLRLTVKAGLIISFSSFIFAIFTFIRAIFHDFKISGYASTIISIWLFSGLIIFILGIIGLYLGKVFDGVKGRPSYIVDLTQNTNEQY